MKLTSFFLLLFCLHVSAKGISQKVSLSVKNASMQSVLAQIEKQTGFTFWYKSDLLKKDKITLTLKNVSLDEALKQCFSGDSLEYKIVDRTIVLKLKTAVLEQLFYTPPPFQLKGRITTQDGVPLSGVNVVLKDKKRGTTTDANGEFSINASNDDILEISYVGYETKYVTVTSESAITVNLNEAKAALTDVVVVGYGKQSRQNLTSAVNTVKKEDLNQGAISDVGQLLQGKVPGLNITASGNPNKPAAVVLRGTSTLNSSQTPFYVIDGVPGADISIIAPDDIASIDVLKDAAATAIYGNRAASGVIMVTTRRAKKGQLQLSYNGYGAVEKVSSKLDMMDADQLRSFLTKNGQSTTDANDKGANTDWQEAIQRKTALSHNHNVSFNGGTDHSNYIASINYFNKEGILKNSSLERIIARLAIEQYAFDDKLKLSLNVSNSNSNASDIPYLNTVLLQSIQYLPVSPIKNPDGTYFENFNTSNYYNPVAMIENSTQNTKYNNLIGNLNAQLKLPFGLTYNLNLSYINLNTLGGQYFSRYFTNNYNGMYDNIDPGTGFHTAQTFGSNGQATRSSYQNESKILETFFNWDKKFGDHTLNAVLGYSWQNNVIGNGFSATTSNFAVDNTSFNNLALSNPYAYSGFRIGLGADGVYQQTRLISDFFRLNYNFKDRYLLQGSIRRDGSSVFGANKQWGYFPSVGAAWRISKEDFMRNQQLFSDLKLRASYGVTGNSSGFNAYSAQTISGNNGTFYYNGTNVAAYGPTQAANANLTWEKTATTNIGLDFGFLKGALSGSIDVYNKNTTGMIYSYAVDPILVPTGSITANGGSINNKGIELSLNARIVNTKDFNWVSSLNLANNTNKITSLSNPLFTGGDSVAVGYPEGGGQSGSSLQLLKVGRPIGQFFSLQYAGKDANGVSQYVGGDGKLTTSPLIGSDYHYLGSAQPKLFVGWNNTFHYKNFDLNVFLRGVFGNKIFNATRADLFRPNTAQYTNILVDAGNESTSDYNAYKYSSRFIENGSYIRFDNATLGYNFKKLNNYIKAIRVYASVNNLFVITKYKGIDPEVNQGGIAPGIDYNNFYPKTRTFLVGANISF